MDMDTATMARGLPRLSPATDTTARDLLRPSLAMDMDTATMARGLPRLSPATVTTARDPLRPSLAMDMDTATMARGLLRLSPAMVTAMATATMDEDATLPKYIHCVINREFSTMSPDAKKSSS